MKKQVLISLILLLTCLGAKSQEQSQPPEKTTARRLGAGDLYFSADTVEMSVISASRSSKKIGELPITIYVVTREEITRNHYYTLTDVLRNLPEMRVSQPGSGELGESFQLRGLTGNLYTLILINGLPIKPSVVPGMPVQAQLPIRQAERIEFIYGPAAAVYGADALSGVINIITREAEKGTFVLADISLGQANFRNTDFMVGGKAGRNKNILQYTFYGGLNQTGDLNISKGYEDVYNPLNYPQEKGVKYTIGSTIYDPVNVTEEILINAGIDPSDFMKDNYPVNYEGSLTLPDLEDLPAESNMLGFQLRYRGISFAFNKMFRSTHSSLGQSSYLYKYNNPRNFWGEDIRTATLSYNHEWTPRFSTTSNISNVAYSMDDNSNMGVTFIDYTDKVYRYSAGNDILLEQLFTFMPTKELEVITGVTYQYSGNLPQTDFLDSPFDSRLYRPFSTNVEFSDSVSGKFGINPLNFTNLSVFIQSYYSYESFRFMAGIRIDNNSVYGSSVSPRLAGLYILNKKTRIRSSVGYAFKAPASSITWQSLSYKAGTGYDSLKYIAIPNPALKPEKYWSFEAGITRKYWQNVNLNISFYYNSIKNIILDKYQRLDELDLPLAIIEPDTATVLTKVNEPEAISRLYGLQANIKINDLVKSINMDAEISLTFAKSTESDPNVFDIASSFLSDFKLTPKHFGQLKISMEPVKNLYIQVSSIWESAWLRVLIPIKDIYNEFISDVDGFYSMDLVADYRIGYNLSTFIKLSNIFNEKYGGPGYSGMNSPLPYSPQKGIGIQVGLTYTLN